MIWLVIHPDQAADLEPGVRMRFVVQETVLPARVMVTDHRQREAMLVPLHGLPEVPELFRLTEQPLGLLPFPLTPVALASIPCPQEPNG